MALFGNVDWWNQCLWMGTLNILQVYAALIAWASFSPFVPVCFCPEKSSSTTTRTCAGRGADTRLTSALLWKGEWGRIPCPSTLDTCAIAVAAMSRSVTWVKMWETAWSGEWQVKAANNRASLFSSCLRSCCSCATSEPCALVSWVVETPEGGGWVTPSPGSARGLPA